MKLYDDKLAPNPRRVRIFLAEKHVTVPTETVSIMKGEHKTPDYRAKNPMAGVPVLELDDGSYISESVAICRYFEETHPNPPLMGVNAKDKALVEMWNRRMELNLFYPVANAFRHTHPAMAALEDQIAPWGELNKTRAARMLHLTDSELGDKAFIAGERFTIADITALCAIDFARIARIAIPDDCANLKRWHHAVSARASAQA